MNKGVIIGIVYCSITVILSILLLIMEMLKKDKQKVLSDFKGFKKDDE